MIAGVQRQVVAEQPRGIGEEFKGEQRSRPGDRGESKHDHRKLRQPNQARLASTDKLGGDF